ncbi:MAG: hypothetical protein GWN58_33585 [Anaerolineae bacterium]|nr:hypothetical protein [Thermoplasmata archaeon]NIV34210.1 hypothetical protein [Anaerolineae bacterium]NIY06059.1 hypothetical protein [Thermoplasmata archaeon]
MDNERTLVLVALNMNYSPVAPHRPGTYIVGWLDGNESDAHDHLNTCKHEQINVLIQNAFMVQIGIEFEPEFERDAQGRPVRGPDGKPVPTGNMGVNQGFSMFPLTLMDHANGNGYGVEATHWIFPKGTMLQDFETQFDVMRDRLVSSRSGLTQHTNLPPGMKPPQA